MSNVSPATSTPRRLDWLDGAKGMGMLLVFYGHFVESFLRLAVPAAYLQMKWVYAFHMPVFFFLSGWLYRRTDSGYGTFALRRARRLLVPVVFFNVLGMALWTAVGFALGLFDGAGWAAAAGEGWLRFVREGVPAWSVVMWFLVALFLVELWHEAVARIHAGTLGALVSLVLGAGATWLLVARGVDTNPWYVRSALAGIVFYEAGVLVRRSGLPDSLSPPARWLGLLGAFAVLMLTFQANTGPFPADLPVVMMVLGSLGDVPLFFVTGLAGVMAVLLLARAVGGARVLAVVGRYSLPLLGLNGLLLLLVNIPLARELVVSLDVTGPLEVAAATAAYTVVSLAACLPIAWALERFLPLAVGRVTGAGAGRPPRP